MLRIPRQFNATFVSRHFFPTYFKNKALDNINYGRCYDWAYFAHRLFGVDLWTTDYHAWVRYGNRWFDSETHNGVVSFMDLRCNIRIGGAVPWGDIPPKRIGNIENFKAVWDEHGGGFRHHWNSMLESDLCRVLGKRFTNLTPIFPKKVQPAMVIP